MDVVVFDDAEAVGAHVAELVLRFVERDPALVLGVATGATLLPVYRALARGSGDFSAVRLVALDEYVGLQAGHPASFAAYVEREIAAPLGITPEQVVVPRGSGAPSSRCGSRSWAASTCSCSASAATGTWPSTSPGRRWTPAAGWWLSARRPGGTTQASFGVEPVPTHALTQGLGTILEARHLVLLATGGAKADAVAAALTGPVTPDCPASVVQLHPRVTVVLDETAAGFFAGAGERRRVRRRCGATAPRSRMTCRGWPGC